MANTWFRMYNQVVEDPKVQRLPLLLFRAWVNLLCIASMHDGVLPDIEDVAYRLRVTKGRAEAIIKELIEAELLERAPGGIIKPHNWEGRQFQSDVSTERVKRFRNAKRNVSETPNETDQTRTDTETDTEQKQKPTPTPPAKVTERPRDLAMDLFTSSHEKHTGVPYKIQSKDGFHLAALRKLFKTANLQMVPDWEQAVSNYFASPLDQYTLADLANRFPVFKNSPLDRFNKPIAHTNGGKNHVRESDAEGRERRTAEAADRVVEEVARKIGGDISSRADRGNAQVVHGNPRLLPD